MNSLSHTIFLKAVVSFRLLLLSRMVMHFILSGLQENGLSSFLLFNNEFFLLFCLSLVLRILVMEMDHVHVEFLRKMLYARLLLWLHLLYVPRAIAFAIREAHSY